jgi:hypothetical protein
MKTRRVPRSRFGPPNGPPQREVDTRPRLDLPIVSLAPSHSFLAVHALTAPELVSLMGLTVVCIRSSGANSDDAGTRPHRPLAVNPASGVGDDVALTERGQRGVDEA